MRVNIHSIMRLMKSSKICFAPRAESKCLTESCSLLEQKSRKTRTLNASHYDLRCNLFFKPPPYPQSHQCRHQRKWVSSQTKNNLRLCFGHVVASRPSFIEIVQVIHFAHNPTADLPVTTTKKHAPICHNTSWYCWEVVDWMCNALTLLDAGSDLMHLGALVWILQKWKLRTTIYVKQTQ